MEQDNDEERSLQSSVRHTGSEQLRLRLPARWGSWTPLAENCRYGPPPAGTAAHSLQEQSRKRGRGQKHEGKYGEARKSSRNDRWVMCRQGRKERQKGGCREDGLRRADIKFMNKCTCFNQLFFYCMMHAVKVSTEPVVTFSRCGPLWNVYCVCSSIIIFPTWKKTSTSQP